MSPSEDQEHFWKAPWDSISELLQTLQIRPEEIKEETEIRILRNQWSELVGPIVSRKSYPNSLKQGLLIILVSHSAYKQEILLLKKELEKRIKVAIGYVPKLQIRIGKIPVSRSVENKPELPSLEGKENLLEKIDLESDPELKEKLKTLIRFF